MCLCCEEWLWIKLLILTGYYWTAVSQIHIKKYSIVVYEQLWSLWKDVDCYGGFLTETTEWQSMSLDFVPKCNRALLYGYTQSSELFFPPSLKKNLIILVSKVAFVFLRWRISEVPEGITTAKNHTPQRVMCQNSLWSQLQIFGWPVWQ